MTDFSVSLRLVSKKFLLNVLQVYILLIIYNSSANKSKLFHFHTKIVCKTRNLKVQIFRLITFATSKGILCADYGLRRIFVRGASSARIKVTSSDLLPNAPPKLANFFPITIEKFRNHNIISHGEKFFVHILTFKCEPYMI